MERTPIGRDALAQARAAASRAPEFRGDIEGFAGHLAGLVADGMVRTDDQVDDLYLAWCCTTGCERALEAFWTRHVAMIRRAATSVTGSAAAADDVVQVVLHRLLVGSDGKPGALADFRGSSRLGRWLRAVAVRQALTARRSHGRKVEDEVVLERLAAESAGPDLALLKHASGRAVEDALRRAIAELSPGQRLVLQQHMVDGLTIDELATIYKIHRATAARRIASARATLVSDMRAHLQASLGLSDGELDSLIDLAQSRIEVSLRWFAEQPEAPA